MTEYSRLDARLLPAFENAIPESLRRRLAKEKNMAAVGAVWDGTPCGVSVVELKYGGALLELAYLFVPEEYRGRGVGSGMVRFLCECAERMDAPLRCLFTAAGKSDPLYGFFADLPDFYVSEETGAVCRIPISGLTASGELMAAEERCKNAVPFFSLPAHDQKSFRRSLEARGIYYLEHMVGLDFEEELCLCAAGAGGPEAAVFFLRDGDELALHYIWCASGRQALLFSLLAKAARRLEERGQDDWLYVAAVEPKAEQALARLFPHYEVVRRFYSAAYEMQ